MKTELNKKMKRKTRSEEEENISAMDNDDLLENILGRLDALSFAAASSVNKTWNKVSLRILSRPKLASALSTKPSFLAAMQEVFDKVLAHPIRPHFAIASVGPSFRLLSTLKRIAKRMGPRIPIVVTYSAGVIGRHATTEELMEFKWEENNGLERDEDSDSSGIMLTIGFVPGLKVDAIPLLKPTTQASQEPSVDSFVTQIMNYTMGVSGNTSPVGIVMFGDEGVDQKPIAQKLDYAMPTETVIVGDERSQFLYKSVNDSLNTLGSARSYLQAVALVFARDRYKPDGVGDIQFHVALSKGVSAIGPRYKAASVKANNSEHATWLTAKREDQQEILDGQQILDNINEELENRIGWPDLYIGVTKRRKCSIGLGKVDYITSLEFHGVSGGDEEYLYVDGGGITTGDRFQFYHSDPNTALTSLRNVSGYLRNLKLDSKSKGSCDMNSVNIVDKKEAFGGIIFSCCGRGKSFYGGESNLDSSPFLENFPEVPLAGLFCGGEIGRSASSLLGQEGLQENSGHISLHVYSTIYLVMSYTPPPSEH